jgi:hypothetical protein
MIIATASEETNVVTTPSTLRSGRTRVAHADVDEHVVVARRIRGQPVHVDLSRVRSCRISAFTMSALPKIKIS